MRAMRILSIGLFLAIIGMLCGLVQDVRDAQAIPAFARKYDFACNVCHVPGFPKLNDTGNLFRDQGYQFGMDQELPTWEGLTKGYWPVSFRTTAGYELASQHVNGGSATTGGVWSATLDVLSFGILDRNISYGIVFTGATANPGNSAVVLESVFTRLMNLERFVGGPTNTYLMNLKVGKFELDIPFSEKRSPTLNNSFVMYHYVPGTPFLQTTLATLDVRNGANANGNGAGNVASYVNPNQFQIGNNQPGIELTGHTKTDVTGGYFRYSLAGITTNLNQGGCGTTANVNPLNNPNATGGPSSCTGSGGHGFDFYGHVTQSFGGYGIVQGQRIGAFVLAGKSPTQDNVLCPGCLGTMNNSKSFTRLGADASLTYDGQWNLFGAWMYANDSAGLFANTQTLPYQADGVTPGRFQNAVWNGGFAQLDYNPTWLQQGKWLLSYRHDFIRNTRQGISTFADNYNNVDANTLLARYYVHQSSRTDFIVHAEFSAYTDKGVGVNGSDFRGQSMLVGFDFAF